MSERSKGFPGGLDGKESWRDAGDLGLILQGKISWRRKRLPAPVFLPGEFHGQRGWQTTVNGATKNQIQLSN